MCQDVARTSGYKDFSLQSTVQTLSYDQTALEDRFRSENMDNFQSVLDHVKQGSVARPELKRDKLPWDFLSKPKFGSFTARKFKLTRKSVCRLC